MPDQNFSFISGEDALTLLKLSETAVNAEDLTDLAQRVLPIVVRVMGANAAILYFEEHKPSIHSYWQDGVQDMTVEAIESICLQQFHQIQIQGNAQPLILSFEAAQENAHVALFLLHSKDNYLAKLEGW